MPCDADDGHHSRLVWTIDVAVYTNIRSIHTLPIQLYIFAIFIQHRAHV